MSDGRGVKPDSAAWVSLAREYGVASVRGQEIVRARLHEGLTASDPSVREALDAWDGPAWAHQDEGGVELVLVRTREAERPQWWLHGVLLALTLLTTHTAGALLVGVDPLGTRFVELAGVGLPYPTGLDWGLLARGAPFAVPFVGILLAHEMGHWMAARSHGVGVTPPFFIPFPAYFSIVGSLGAFIRIKGPMVRRSVLLDVGASGPVVSFLLSVPVAAGGLLMSEPLRGAASLATPYVVSFAGEAIWVGDGVVFHLLAGAILPEAGARPVLLHPMAFAGWLGLFVTALNLLPLGQLDGGHVLYAIRPRVQRTAGRWFLLGLLPLGFLWWGWWLWAVVAFLVNRGRLAHPPVLQEAPAPGRGRTALGVACVIVFFLTFTPVPVRLPI